MSLEEEIGNDVICMVETPSYPEPDPNRFPKGYTGFYLVLRPDCKIAKCVRDTSCEPEWIPTGHGTLKFNLEKAGKVLYVYDVMDFYKQEYVIRQRDIVVIFKERYSLGLSFLENTIPTMRRNLADIFMNENEYISE